VGVVRIPGTWTASTKNEDMEVIFENEREPKGHDPTTQFLSTVFHDCTLIPCVHSSRTRIKLTFLIDLFFFFFFL
jgi:hypothetical protein